ncbi:hypothetical protein M427DRAFT_60542 [Gonapodya prolifera JEL478]|uniref:Uncharacterized protein n=1 Tax=Gonapodya prolifera (strain JEL478) TaxID=1344416 RepID=A0A139A4U3_GONPJ|nr:hypothetical protein M427DRAFT_60542 [Gonapodya prolifera JEL478]|eukprot:KXS11515.1 hypothetical protein M427DRAFT_60542 [Gonapodya prolifera JEL478]
MLLADPPVSAMSKKRRNKGVAVAGSSKPSTSFERSITVDSAGFHEPKTAEMASTNVEASALSLESKFPTS